jgi:lactate racemase
MAAAVQSNTNITVPFGAWHDEAQLPLIFPQDWDVRLASPADAPAMTDEQIEEAFSRPIGTPPLRQLAAGRSSAVIAVDDLTRPTPAHRFLPRLIEELVRGGIAENRIRILLGAAAHRPMTESELNLKLGPEVCSRFHPIMHDFMGPDVRFVGWVHGGPVYLNRHFLEADLRICVGGVIPHGEAAFGGGAKMVIPGLAGRLTIAHFHGALPPRPAGQLAGDPGVLDRRAWAEEVARHVGTHVAVCAVVNSRRGLAGLYVGDVVEAHRAAALQAAAIGRTLLPREVINNLDITVVNAYPLDTDPIQMGKSISVARKLSSKLTVIINAACDGIFYHGMGMGSGVNWRRLLRNVPGWLLSPASQLAWLRGMCTAARKPILTARFCYFSLNHLKYRDFAGSDGRRSPDQQPCAADGSSANPLVFSRRFPAWALSRKYRHAALYRDWDALAAVLASRFSRARVLVFPCAPLQLVEYE